jgi:hypothetical protein
MRRPRARFAASLPGGLGSPSAPTTRGCLEWLDEVSMKGGESCPDRGGRMPPVGTRKIRSRGQKSRDGAPRGAASSKGDAHIENGRAARCSIPSIFARGTKSDDGVPGAAKNTGGGALALHRCHARQRVRAKRGPMTGSGGHPALGSKCWIPAFAGMTSVTVLHWS